MRSRISGVIGLPVPLMKLNRKRVESGFARRSDVVQLKKGDMFNQALAKGVYSFYRSDSKEIFGFEQMKFLFLGGSHDIPTFGWCVKMTR